MYGCVQPVSVRSDRVAVCCPHTLSTRSRICVLCSHLVNVDARLKKQLFGTVLRLGTTNVVTPASSLLVRGVCIAWRESARAAVLHQCLVALLHGVLNAGMHNTVLRLGSSHVCMCQTGVRSS